MEMGAKELPTEHDGTAANFRGAASVFNTYTHNKIQTAAPSLADTSKSVAVVAGASRTGSASTIP